MRKVYYLPLCIALLFPAITGLAQAGSPDAGFGGGSGFVITSINTGDDIVTGMAVQKDGKVILVGHTNDAGDINPAIARYNADGTPDAGFGSSGILTIDTLSAAAVDAALGVTIQNDTKIVIAGVADYGGPGAEGFVLRLNIDGTPDLSFGSNGVARTGIESFPSVVKIQTTGKIILAGVAPGAGSDDYFVARLSDTDGSLDGTFGTGGIVTTEGAVSTDDALFGMTLQTDDKIVLAGYSKPTAGGDNDFAIIRFNGTDGSLDGSFGTGGKVLTDIGANTDDHAYGIAVDGNGDIFVTGYTENADRDLVVVKYSGANGGLVNTFGTGGKLVLDFGSGDEGKAVAIQNDGKMVIAFTSAGFFNATRIDTTTGSTDASFGTAGVSTININVNSEELLTLQLNHTRIFIGGTRGVLGVDDFAVAVLQNDASALPLNLLNFTAQKQNNDIVLHWQTEKEESIVQFVVERSADGHNFTPVGNLLPAKTGSLVKNYTFYDQQPLAAVNYYRLAIKEVDEHIIRSKILAIKFNKQASGQLDVFPNPAIGNTLRMQLPDGLTGKVNIQVLDATGRIVRKIYVQTNGGSSIATSLDVGSLQKGVYFLRVEGSAREPIITRFLKN